MHCCKGPHGALCTIMCRRHSMINSSTVNTAAVLPDCSGSTADPVQLSTTSQACPALPDSAERRPCQ
jgi:hypothetical protein